MTKDIGCRVRVADKLEGRDFARLSPGERKPGAVGIVDATRAYGEVEWRTVRHEDGTAGRYYADELSELRAVKVGDKVRTAAKLTATFAEMNEWPWHAAVMARRTPNVVGEVIDGGIRGVSIVEDANGTATPYLDTELTALDAPMVLDGEHKYPDASFDDGTPVESVDEVEREKFYGNFEPMMRACMRLQVANGGCAVAMLDGKARYVRVRVSQSETPDEHAASDSKANRDRWIALGLTDGVYPEPGFVHSEAREAVLLDACERLTGQLADAHRALDIAEATRESNGRALEVHERVDALATSRDELQAKATLVHQALDEAKVPMSNGRMLNLFERVQILIAMRDSRQWGDEPKPASRPRAGGFVHKGSGSAVYDANGHRVGGTWRTGVGWGWDANQSFAPSVVYAAADLPSEADACAACLASLRTWADVEGEESDAPKASEGFGGTRVRTLGEAVDGAHVVRLALYGFADGSEVPYLEAHETHDGARAGRVMSLSAAVHLMQNVSDDEVWTIGSREKAGESK